MINTELETQKVTPKQYYKTCTREKLEQVAEAAKTTFLNFQQIAIANGCVSKDLAARIAEASNYEMTEMEILYPERFQGQESA